MTRRQPTTEGDAEQADGAARRAALDRCLALADEARPSSARLLALWQPAGEHVSIQAVRVSDVVHSEPKTS